MSAFSTQFALSLELTSLVPALVNQAQTGLTWLARELRNSGSDIVVEEDLAHLFGRCYIAPNMSRTFRTVVGQDSNVSTLIDSIVLFNGSGPTVKRALTEPPGNPYFAMVVQCSLLSATHDASDLAGALARAIEREQDVAPEGHQTRGLLSIESIRTMLVAIDEQTAQFDWRNVLLAISCKLEFHLPNDIIHETIPSTVLEGLIIMLASVQRFPEERILLIETDKAACVLVAWAHHVLGMSVLVRHVVDGQKRTEIFGNEPEQVIIDLDAKWQQNSSAILMSSDGSQLFKLRVEHGEEFIDSTCRAPARGLGSRHLQRTLFHLGGDARKLGKEGMLLSAAIASKFCNHLRIGMVDDISTAESFMPYKVPKSNLYAATQFLFDTENISAEDIDCIETYANLLHGTTVMEMEMDMEMDNKLNTTPELDWKTLIDACVHISVFIYAFAHVTNLHQCDEFAIDEQRTWSRFTANLSKWKIGSPLAVYAHDCISIMGRMMAGDAFGIDFQKTGLVCSGGWSVFLSSMTVSDPSFVRAVSVVKGVPCRGGVYKHRILDGPSSVHNLKISVLDGPGSQLSPVCLDAVSLGKTYVGERGDSFLVTFRYLKDEGDKGITLSRTGFSNRSLSLWITQTTAKCAHVYSERDTIELPPDCHTISGSGIRQPSSIKGRVFICLTSGNKHARWAALVGFTAFQETIDNNGKRRGHYPVLLKTDDTCLQCAVDEALSCPISQPCVLVL
ncbi:hypothetical protein F4818DRAFT_153789 [Hypoxylon cercidicola]|nr:hypothetical protein F4818DRAFT_153789 [Hypoxylon cercidicola]